MGWVTAAVSGVAATVGVTALVVGLQSDASGDGPADVWIDGPLAEAQLAPGEITVSAHATAETRIEDLVLEVDGKEVADAADVERNGKLVYATFSWEADEGQHVLVVAQEGGDGARSAERLVYVGDPLTPVPAKPTPKPSAKPSETPTPSETPSASETASESATPTAEPKPEPQPQPTRTHTPEPEPKPFIEAADFETYPPVLYQFTCGYSVAVQAEVVHATAVTVIIAGTDKRFSMTADGTRWYVLMPSGFDPDEVGDHTVTVKATGPGGSASIPIGTLTVKANCPKD